jgi:hypothetical protein
MLQQFFSIIFNYFFSWKTGVFAVWRDVIFTWGSDDFSFNENMKKTVSHESDFNCK